MTNQNQNQNQTNNTNTTQNKFQTFNGNLVYNDYGQYELHNKNGVIINLSKLLDKVYYNQIDSIPKKQDANYIDIRIMDGTKILFEEEGILYLRENEKLYKIYDMYINGENLSEVLFDSVDKNIEIKVFALAFSKKDISQFRTFKQTQPQHLRTY